MPDTLILSNAAFSIDPTPAAAPAVSAAPPPGWAVLAPGVYWHGDAAAYAALPTIDIVGVADSHAVKAHFLLLA